MLPTQPKLAQIIEKIITGNPMGEETDNEDAKKAIDYFSNQLSIELLKIFTEADVILLPGSIKTTVTTTTGAGTGVNLIQVQGKIR